MDRCDECGYDYGTLARDELSERIRQLAADLADIVRAMDTAAARRRPAEGVWSPLEYCCHVRDVLQFQDRRVRQAQVEDTPAFAPMRRDERAVSERYNEQDPAAVAVELETAAAVLAATLDGFTDEAWQRTGGYGYPHPAIRTVEWVARHTVHEQVHHMRDVERQGAAARPAEGTA